MELNTDALQQRERIFHMQQDLEGMEKRIARVTKAAKQLQKAHQMMNAAAVEFQQSLIPFASGKEDDILLHFSRSLEKVNESESNLGERISPMIIDALNRFVDNEVKVGLDLHQKMVRARDAFDNKLARSKKGQAEEKKREFEEANVRYVQKLIEVQTISLSFIFFFPRRLLLSDKARCPGGDEEGIRAHGHFHHVDGMFADSPQASLEIARRAAAHD